MFENFTVPSLFVSNSASLSLYASGRTKGVVINSGFGITHVVPIIEDSSNTSIGSSPIHEAIYRVDLTGNDLTEYMIKILAERGYDFRHRLHRKFVPSIIEKVSYVAFDFAEEMAKPQKILEEGGSFELPDGKTITIGSERFLCPEALFQPSFMFERDASSDIHQTLYESIMKCDSRIQKDLFANIVLAGGNTMFKGFGDRIEKELKALVPTSTKIKVIAPEKYAAWIGGSMLATLSTFASNWVTQEAFDEVGPTIMNPERSTKPAKKGGRI